MTTATRRLRRASIAGLATVATGIAVVGGAGSALAFTGTAGTVALATAATASTLTPGVANQALPSVVLSLANGSFTAGEYVTFTLSSTTPATTPISNTTTNLNNTAVLATTPAVATADSTGGAVTNATVTESASAHSPGNDTFTVALPASPSDTGTTAVTISNLSVSLGAAVPAGAVYLAATASSAGTGPFAGPSKTAGVQVGTVATLSVSASSIGVAPSQTNVVPPNVTITDVTGGQITAGLLFTLPAGDSWAVLPTLTSPSGVTSTTGSTTGGVSVQYVLTGTTPANGVYTLSGGQVNFGATTGPALLVIKTGTSPSTTAVNGTGTQIAFVGAQNRIGGADRYGTAALIYNEVFSGAAATGTGITPAFAAFTASTNVVVTSGTNFPDALSSAYLASSLNTGILLTDPNSLSQSTQTALTNGKITTVYIVGGTAAVSQNVQNAIAALKNPISALNLNVIRVAGSDRYATNEAADLNAGVVGSGSQTAVLATGTNFADALAAAPAIAKTHDPLILTNPTSLSASAAATITALGVRNVIILGGTSAVSTAVETAIKALPGVTVLQRVAGADRTLTAEQIALWETQGLAAGSYTALLSLGFHWAAGGNVNISNGANFPDALAAGPALAKAGAGSLGEPLLLTTSPTALGAGIPAFLSGSHTEVSTVSGIGLASAVSPTVLASAGGSIS